MLNETILNKYQIDEIIRESQTAVTYEGIDVESGERVIVTAPRVDLVPADDFISRFELAAETLQRIETPYAPQLLAYGEHGGQAVVMGEFVEGQTLAEMLAGRDGLPENLVLDIAQQIGEYLKVLHQADLLHASLSPDTILLSSEGTVQIRDAGIAQGMSLNQLLADGVIEASPYLAPELRAGEEPTTRTDFYALGATLYEALTGEPLELDSTDPWPGNKKHGLSPELDELVVKCLQPAPTRRTQSAAEFITGIKEVRRGQESGAQDTILGMEDVLVGHTLGAYQLTERLGQGGMATVYKAYEPNLDRYVAIKVLPQFFARDPSFMNRFRREAKAVAQLNHPSIMPIYSYGEEGDITYIAMQYVPGGTLKQGRGQVYKPDEAIRLALPIGRALAYAHGRGIVHRDVKPSNVLLGEGDWLVLADFGLAKMAEASQKLTGTGVGIGTPMYMSPEQGQGTGVDHRTDIYSMGIMLYEMLTGDVPFRADTPMAVVIKHMTAPLPMPREANPDIPEALERIILKATAKSADDRYQTAEEMVTALERVQNTLLAGVAEAVPLAESTQTEIAAPREKSPLKKAGIILGSIVGVLLLGVILMWVFDICPPEGLWPIPPWCEGTSYQLPTIGQGQEAATQAPSQPAAVPAELGAVCAAGQNLALYEDFENQSAQGWDFSDVFGESTEPWAIETEEDGNHALRDSGYWANYNAFSGDDYVVSLRLRMDANALMNLNIRLAEDRYIFSLGGAEVVLGKDAGEAQLAVVPVVVADGSWHDVRLAAQGGLITFELDGVRLDRVSRSKSSPWRRFWH
ncbi:MAG: protein kinase [Chloroflexota bacterium]|nr:protein kinase [Chloroflexota bacterium]